MNHVLHPTSAPPGRQPKSSSTPPKSGSAGVDSDASGVSSFLRHEVISLPPRKRGVFERLRSIETHVRDSHRFAEFLRETHPERAAKLLSCGGWVLLREFVDDGDVKVAKAAFCQQPLWCGFCAAGRASRQSLAIVERLNHYAAENPDQRPYMVTLTMRSRDDLDAMVREFWDAWSSMVKRRSNALAGRRTSSVLERIAGGLIAGEAKRGKGGRWHYHAHGIWFSDSIASYLPVARSLAHEWGRQVVQESAIVQFRPMRGHYGDAIREVVKYAAKWEPGVFADRLTAAEALHRVRRVRTFGDLHGLKLPESLADDFSDDEGRQVVEQLFTLGRDGYRLRRRRLKTLAGRSDKDVQA